MKKPQIDLLRDSTQRYINQLGFKNKFLRLWGTEGEVLKEKHYYYPTISPNDVKLFKLLGIYKNLVDAQGNMQGVANAWIYLNPKKNSIDELTDELLIQQLEFDIEDGIYTINIIPNLIHKRTDYRTGQIVGIEEDKLGLLNYTDKTALGEYIKNNYSEVTKHYLVEAAVNDPAASLVAMFILNGSSAFECTISSVEYALTNRVKVVETEDGRETYRYSIKTISIDLDIKQIGIVTRNDQLVKSIMEIKEEESRRKEATTASNASREVDGFSYKTTITNELWLASKLRVSAFNVKTLKTKDLIKVLQESLDSDYEKESVPWYKKFIGIVVFIVVFYFTGGVGATSFGAFAAAFSIATIAVVGLTAAMAAWGDDSGATEVGKFAKAVSVASTVIGIAALIQAVTVSIQQAAIRQVAAEVSKEGLKLSAAEIAKQASARSLLDTLKGMVSEMFKSGLTTKLSLERTMMVINKLHELHSKNKLEDLKDKLKSLEEQNAEYAQFEEESNTRDLGRAIIKSHGELFHQNSVDKYDYMYESWRSPMHTGNIQRTSWKWNRTGDKINLSDHSIEL